ncbi:MAG TPA: ATP-binding protein [Verrucomicrobiae bacterium]|nr:ATP-binding protein [Verrucomicrobiae bacterium]
MSEISQATLINSPDDVESSEPALTGRPSVSLPGISVALLALLVVVTLVGGYSLHVEVAKLLSQPGLVGSTAKVDQDIHRRIQDLSDWQLSATLFTAGIGVVLIALAAAALKRARREWEGEWDERSARWSELVRDLKTQLGEKRKVEIGLKEQQFDLQAKLATLAKSHTQLQEEMNRLKVAEEVFSHQRRELVRSKDVLELHVQARTQQLQKLQRAYELILNSAGEGICGLDGEGKVTFANPAAAKMLGTKVSELVGKTAQTVFPHLVPGGNAAGAGEGNQPSVVTVTRTDQTRFTAEYVRTPIRENERIIGEVLMFKDITERKRSEESLAQKAAELARSNAELEQFAFVASHDLQEPLRKIQAFGDRLKAKCDAVNLQDGRDYLDRMQNAAARMQTLIYDLLTFSRVISRNEPFVPVDLKRVTQEVIGDLEVRIEKSGAKIELGDLPTIEADAPQMRQLLLNLIGNALKFHAPGKSPVVEVSARMIPAPLDAKGPVGSEAPSHSAGTTYCELTVKDNGIGFDEKYLDRIFAVFQRLHGRQEYEGTGIGLAVCRRIVDRHGGRITAHSKPGEGATFIVTLPASAVAKTKGDE